MFCLDTPKSGSKGVGDKEFVDDPPRGLSLFISDWTRLKSTSGFRRAPSSRPSLLPPTTTIILLAVEEGSSTSDDVATAVAGEDTDPAQGNRNDKITLLQ